MKEKKESDFKLMTAIMILCPLLIFMLQERCEILQRIQRRTTEVTQGMEREPQRKVLGWEVTWSAFIDIYTDEQDLGQCFNVIYEDITRSKVY